MSLFGCFCLIFSIISITASNQYPWPITNEFGNLTLCPPGELYVNLRLRGTKILFLRWRQVCSSMGYRLRTKTEEKIRW